MNWDQRIERAEKTRYFTANDIMYASCDSTCSLGEHLHNLYGRMYIMETSGKYMQNAEINKLATDFTNFVKCYSIEEAKDVHESIKKIKMNRFDRVKNCIRYWKYKFGRGREQ